MYLIISFIAQAQAICLLAVHAILGLFKNPRYTRDYFQQMDDIGVKSTGLAMLTGLFTGGVLALQSASSLKAFGAVNLTGQLVSVALVVELGPVLTGLMLAGRVGSGIASQLGSMMVTEQIDAMRALGTDPVKKLVTPRVLACTMMLPLLTVVADFFGLVGGWLVSFYTLKLNTALYWSTSLNALDYRDALEGLLKPVVFGFIVGIVGCYYGLRQKSGTREVGLDTTRAVVTADILIIASDFFLSKLVIEV